MAVMHVLHTDLSSILHLILETCKLCINSNKYFLMTSLVVFVKYVINPHGMTMDKEQIQSIEDGKQSQL